MQFKTGMRAKIREDLIIGKYYNSELCEREHAKHAGKVVTVGNYASRLFIGKEVNQVFAHDMAVPVDEAESIING